MLTVVTFLWHRTGEPQLYTAQHVNTVYGALQHRLRRPHRFVCVTDTTAGLDTGIVCVPMTQQVVDASFRRYLKLVLFRRDAAALFGGDRLLFLDLDVTPVGDLTPLVDRDEDFVIWQDPLKHKGPPYRYNSSMILMNAGCRPQVYETFDANKSPDAIRAANLIGSDQAWIGLTLGPDEAVWTQADGVLGWKHDLDKGRTWPDNARLIVSHSKPKPWELEIDHPLRVAYEAH